jgi:hypothetical protein
VPVVALRCGGEIQSITAGESFEASEAESVLQLVWVEHGRVRKFPLSPR